MRRSGTSGPATVLSGALALVLLFGDGRVSAQPPAAGVTTVSPVTARGAAPIPLVGAGAPQFTPDEIHAKGQNARTIRSDFEDDRAELDECYLKAFDTRPNPERMIGYEDGADAARRLSDWARVAEEKTEAAQQARIDQAQGKTTATEVARAELERQSAVMEVVKAEMDLD